jgi:hypothetical protein
LSRSIESKITEQVPRVASPRETGDDSTKKPPCGGPFVQTNPRTGTFEID